MEIAQWVCIALLTIVVIRQAGLIKRLTDNQMTMSKIISGALNLIGDAWKSTGKLADEVSRLQGELNSTRATRH